MFTGDYERTAIKKKTSVGNLLSLMKHEIVG